MQGESTAATTSPPHPTPSSAPASAEPKSSSPTMSGALLKDGEPQSSDPAGSDVKEPSSSNLEDKSTEAAPPASTAADVAMEDAPVAITSTDGASEPNGTPSSSKKSQNGKRKSSSGVPEHKNKKLNKKKSMPKITHLDAAPGEYYFARLKSYPPWPAVICDEGMLPQSLLGTRPVTTKQPDGSYREAYDDGGKRVHERTFPIMFLHTNEFAWLPNTDLSPLTADECKNVSEKGKSKSLIQAYHVAAEGHDIEYFKGLLTDHQKALRDDQDAREARDAAKAAKTDRADKKKRKSDAAAEEEDEDVEMEDADSGEKPKKSSKKRKKDPESDAEEEKPAKTPKTATKLKLTTPKAPSSGEKKGKESAKAAKSKSEKRKSKAAAVSDEETAEDVKEPEKELDPAEAKAKKEKEVLFLRHKLQKGFLARDQVPQESEMTAMSGFISKLENYGDLEVSIIRGTKINKVLKALIKLNTIPKDEEFNFKSRSLKLLERWNKALGAESTADENAAPASADKDDQPTTNGIHKDEPAAVKDKKDSPAEVKASIEADEADKVEAAQDEKTAEAVEEPVAEEKASDEAAPVEA